MELNRRTLLALGGACGVAALSGTLSATPAYADDARTVTVNDLGPAVTQFSLMSGVLVGNILYIGSRNLNPPRVIGFDMTSRTVVSRTDLGSGYSIQALAVDPTGRYLYIGALREATTDGTNLYRWDLADVAQPAVALPSTGDRDVRALTVAPDGRVYVAGGGLTADPPSLWEYDPTTNLTSSWGIPDSGATIAQAVAATASTVYFGTGSVLAGGGGASRGRLWAYDRTTKTPSDILPAEFASSDSISALSIVGDLLAVAPHGLGKTALLQLADPTLYTTIPKTGAHYVRSGNLIYFVKVPNVWAWNLTTKKLTQIEQDDLGTLWSLDVLGQTIVGPSADGYVAEVNLADHSVRKTDLEDAGAPAGPQLGMGIAAGGGLVYTGGTATLAAHDLNAKTVTNITLSGEAKDAVVVDGVVYTGQYNGKGIWAYDPTTGLPPYQAAALPQAQNRPLDVEWDPTNRLVLVGAQSDTQGGGSFTAYDPAAKTARTWVNPIDAQQMVRAVATASGVAYLGGDNIYATGPRSTVVAFDPVSGTELWRLDPAQTAGIAGLAIHGDLLFGMTRQKGGIFVINLPTRTLVTTIAAADVLTDFGALVTSQGLVYGVSDSTVFRIDPATLELSTVVANIDGGWYSGPHIAADENGLLYTLRGSDLVQIVDAPAGTTPAGPPATATATGPGTAATGAGPQASTTSMLANTGSDWTLTTLIGATLIGAGAALHSRRNRNAQQRDDAV